MEKDFTVWHEVKTNLQKADRVLFFQEREIWICSVGINLGREQDGKSELFLRPVIILRKFDVDSFWGIPLTSTLRMGAYHFQFPFGGRLSTAMLSQMRLLDGKRLIRKAGMMSVGQFNELKVRVRVLLS